MYPSGLYFIETKSDGLGRDGFSCCLCAEFGETKAIIKHRDNCPLIPIGKIIKAIKLSHSINFVIDSYACQYCGMSGYTANEIDHSKNCPIILIQQFEEFF